MWSTTSASTACRTSCSCFFFNDTATTEIYTLSLHDALPICRIIYQQGLSDYLGHPSARVPGTERVVVKPKHSVDIRGMDHMTADDMIVVDLDGRQLDGDYAPPAEVYIHTEIYRARPDVLGIVH